RSVVRQPVFLWSVGRSRVRSSDRGPSWRAPWSSDPVLVLLVAVFRRVGKVDFPLLFKACPAGLVAGAASRGGGGSGNDPGTCGDGFVSVEKGEFSCGGGRRRLRCVLAEDGVVSRGGGVQGRGTGAWCGVVDLTYPLCVGEKVALSCRAAAPPPTTCGLSSLAT